MREINIGPEKVFGKTGICEEAFRLGQDFEHVAGAGFRYSLTWESCLPRIIPDF